MLFHQTARNRSVCVCVCVCVNVTLLLHYKKILEIYLEKYSKKIFKN